MERTIIFDGKEKRFFATEDTNKVEIQFSDVTLAFDSIKRACFKGKGALENQISAMLLNYLNSCGIRTHFIKLLSENSQLCQKINIIPIEVIVRNRICGSLASRLGVKDGVKQENTIIDLRYNNDDLLDPLINEHHAVALGLVSYDELYGMMETARKTNDILKNLFHKLGIELIDIKLEFGRATDSGEIIISDEISPDTCRLWDETDGRRLDKDRFRLDMSDVVASYRDVFQRLSTYFKNN